MTTEYTESVAGFGDHIVVDFLKNDDKSSHLGDTNVILSMTLSELKNLTKDAVKNDSPRYPWYLGGAQLGEKSGIKAGTVDNMYVKFRFNENDQDQNAYQGANLSLTWKFDAQQTAGESK